MQKEFKKDLSHYAPYRLIGGGVYSSFSFSTSALEGDGTNWTGGSVDPRAGHVRIMESLLFCIVDGVINFSN